ncbi:fidgetin-like isoform X1 [Pungitius pungitius]|uniref:fidgetin-like isoform X1 n=2 Tax=Pungitius pungitius TaxID=134920 RepID=UPI0018881E38|nr:fidgetin-like isoform X1 [Pungitius pungitius]
MAVHEMISSSSVYGLKMQWTPEHSQWAEQHFDISSTTRSPAHKAEAYRAVPGHLQRSAAYQYAWANDDISALTASNLLKKYAEKYSGILEMPGSYSETSGVMNGRKGESEPWQDGVYPMSCIPEGVSIRKGGVAAASEVVSGMCSSPGLASSTLSEPSYSSSSCGSHTATALHTSSMTSQEYAPPYGGSYLHGSYGSQSAPAPALPSPLHSSGLLQPPPPPPSHPTLVPAYNGGSPNVSSYNYPPAGYSAQSSVGPGYSPGGAPPPSSYLPSGIAAPTPLPPSSALPGYPYQSHNLTPIAPTPLNSNSSNTLKRKAFYMAGQGDLDSAYGNFGYGQARSAAESPMYRIADSSSANGGSSSAGGGGFDRSAEKSSLPFNPQKQSTMSSEQQQRKYSSQAAGGPLTPPAYVTSTLGGSRSTDSLASFTSPSLSEQGADDHRLHLSHSAPGPTSSSSTSSSRPAEEQLKSSDPHLLDMVTSEIVQQGPPVDWSDIAGLELAKASLKEEVLWPILRPDMFSSLGPAPRCVLLFGPQGSGRTLLGRCLASQLGAPFLQLNGSTLATKWLAEGEKILRASFLVARCRQPSVLFISEVDMLLSAHLSEESPVNRLKAELLAQLDSLLMGSGDDGGSQVLVVCSTSRPQDMDEGLRRYFARRVLVPLPDGGARHQIVGQLLAQSQHKYCLSEEELALLVQRTEGFSGLDVARLCQEALVGLLHVSAQGMDMSGMMPRGQVRPLTYQDFESVFCKFQASISQKEIDTYIEWNKMFGCSQ